MKIDLRFFMLLSLSLCCGNFACKNVSEKSAIREVVDSNHSAPAAGGELLEVLSGKMNAVSEPKIARILEAWRSLVSRYYEIGDGYVNHNSLAHLPVRMKTKAGSEFLGDKGDIPQCLDASPAVWSDLMAHYYAHMPGYTEGLFPNFRECFTEFVVFPDFLDEAGNAATLNYYAALDYCAMVPVDHKDLDINSRQLNNWHKTHDRPFPRLQDTNFSATNPVGPMKWLYENQRDVFQYIMLSAPRPSSDFEPRGGASGPCTIDPRIQQDIINRLYGVSLGDKNDYSATDATQVEECLKKRPIWEEKDPVDGTHCSFDLRKKMPLAENCYE